jgi:peptidylprolyl isomerase
MLELAGLAFAHAAVAEASWREVPADHLLLIETDEGPITVLLSEHLAQDHVEQLRTLTKQEFYDGLSFYRVIEGFVAQGGDHSDRMDKGRASKALAPEFEEPLPDGAVFTPLESVDGYAYEAGFIGPHEAGRARDGTVWLAHCTGAFAFARDDDPASASTEFYITLQPQRYLDRNLTVAGKVIDGMTTVQRLPRGVVGESGRRDDFDGRATIISMRFASELPEAGRPRYEVIDTASPAFREMIESRKARPEPFFVHRPGHVDLCQVGVPVRDVPFE